MIPALPLVGAVLNGFIALLCRSRRKPVPKPLVSVIGVAMPLLAFVAAVDALFYCISGFSGPLPRYLPAALRETSMKFGFSPRYLLPLEPFISIFIAVGIGAMLDARRFVVRYAGAFVCAGLLFAAHRAAWL